MRENNHDLEYIESTGTQYIDTGVMPSEKTGFYIDFSIFNNFTTSSGWGAILGTTDSNSNGTQRNRLDIGSWTGLGSSGYIYFGATTSNSNAKSAKTAGLEKNTRLTISLKNGIYTDPSGMEKTFETESFMAQHSLVLFARYWNSQICDYSKIKLYSFKLYNGNTLIKDFVPSHNIITNSAGLYDINNHKFYPNYGTGAFSAPENNN